MIYYLIHSSEYDVEFYNSKGQELGNYFVIRYATPQHALTQYKMYTQNDILDLRESLESGATIENKVTGKTTISNSDGDTGGLPVTNKFAPDGWKQRVHEVEFTLSKYNSIHDRDYLDNDYGWSSIDFYESIDGVETLIDLDSLADDAARQAKLDSSCIRTDFKWMPNLDYMALSGHVYQEEETTENIYMWGLFVDLEPVLGGPQVEILGGGMNFAGVDKYQPKGLEGVSGSVVYYNGVVGSDNNFVELPSGMGSNRIRFIFRHPLGNKHRFFSLLKIFRAV